MVRRAEASATSHNEILSYWDGIAAWEISGNAMHRAVQKVLLANGEPKQALDAAGAEVDMAPPSSRKARVLSHKMAEKDLPGKSAGTTIAGTVSSPLCPFPG